MEEVVTRFKDNLQTSLNTSHLLTAPCSSSVDTLLHAMNDVLRDIVASGEAKSLGTVFRAADQLQASLSRNTSEIAFANFGKSFAVVLHTLMAEREAVGEGKTQGPQALPGCQRQYGTPPAPLMSLLSLLTPDQHAVFQSMQRPPMAPHNGPQKRETNINYSTGTPRASSSGAPKVNPDTHVVLRDEESLKGHIKISNISASAKPWDVRSLLMEAGEVSEFRMPLQEKTLVNRGIAFCKFAEDESIAKAKELVVRRPIFGQTLNIERFTWLKARKPTNKDKDAEKKKESEKKNVGDVKEKKAEKEEGKVQPEDKNDSAAKCDGGGDGATTAAKAADSTLDSDDDVTTSSPFEGSKQSPFEQGDDMGGLSPQHQSEFEEEGEDEDEVEQC